jgi:hypothetical protein
MRQMQDQEPFAQTGNVLSLITTAIILKPDQTIAMSNAE